MKVPICKNCGHPIVSDEIGIVLTPIQRRVFNIVKSAGTAGISAREIVEIVYANDKNGGPSSRNFVAVVCNQMNRRLVQFSVAIKARRGWGGLYTLRRVQAARWVHVKGSGTS